MVFYFREVEYHSYIIRRHSELVLVYPGRDDDRVVYLILSIRESAAGARRCRNSDLLSSVGTGLGYGSCSCSPA